MVLVKIQYLDNNAVGLTPLIRAADRGNLDIVHLLLTRGADVDMVL